MWGVFVSALGETEFDAVPSWVIGLITIPLLLEVMLLLLRSDFFDETTIGRPDADTKPELESVSVLDVRALTEGTLLLFDSEVSSGKGNG